MKSLFAAAACVAALPLGGGALADSATPVGALARMPVKEVTVFKDGHAFVLHEGSMPTDANGNVQMDYLPTPVIGTFWPYSGDKNVKLSAVTATRRRVLVERTAMTLRELIEANPGVDVGVTETNDRGFAASIVGVPTRSADEILATSPPNTDEKLPEKSGIVLLKTTDGVAAMSLDGIKNVTFKKAFKDRIATEEFRNLLTLKLDWPGGKPAKTADVGMVYLQKGIRWIPSYKVDLDGKGKATIRMEATLINEMTDLRDVTANLVIGVPTFAFKDTVDPMSLQQAVAQLSQYFDSDARSQYAFSNAIMTQQARFSEYRAPAGPAGPAAPDLGPDVAGSDRAEDLYVFNVKHVTLLKGQRMVVPIRQFTVTYKDVYTLDLPFAPPPELRGNINNEQEAQLARLFNAPKVIHAIRINNATDQPLTTAPALITEDDRVLAQGMMTYTSAGGSCDLPITAAVDVKVKRTDTETSRTPNALVWRGDQYARVDLAGTITLTNLRGTPVEVEVNRSILGLVDKADHNGTAAMLNSYEDADLAVPRPVWWSWYSWPYWWSGVNGFGRFSWKVTVPVKQKIDLGYTWHYFWR